MAHEVESMAFAGQLPWHGLGVNVDADQPVEHWLKMAGLDWEVEMRPMFTAIQGGDTPTVGDTPVPSHRALVRKTDNRVLSVTGDRWQPIQNADFFKFFSKFAEAGGAKMETAGSLRGGQIVWGLMSLQDKFTVAGKSDIVKGYLLGVSPHVLGRAWMSKVTGVRVVCANTLAMATTGTGAIEKRFSHANPWDHQIAADAMGLVREEFVKFGKLANQLAKLRLSDVEVLTILRPIVDPGADQSAPIAEYEPNRTVAGVLESYTTAPGATPGNGWGLLNAVTHYSDHVAGSKTGQDGRLDSAWLGTYANRKAKVLEVLTTLV